MKNKIKSIIYIVCLCLCVCIAVSVFINNPYKAAAVVDSESSDSSEAFVSKSNEIIETVEGEIKDTAETAEIPIKKEEKSPSGKKSRVKFIFDSFRNSDNLANYKFTQNGSYKNIVSPFFYTFEGKEIELYTTKTDFKSYVKKAKKLGMDTWPTIASLEASNSKLRRMHSFMKSKAKRKKFIKKIDSEVKKYKFKGICIDFEYMKSSDSSKFTTFIKELSAKLKKRGAKVAVCVTVPDGSKYYSLCYNRKTLSKYAKYLVLMAYCQGGSGSLHTTSGYDWIEMNLKKMIKRDKVSANKIIVAVPLFMNLYTKPKGKKYYELVRCHYNDYKALLKSIPKKRIKVKKWLKKEKQYYMYFSDKKGRKYKVWVEDKKSLKYKFKLERKYKLAGFSLWEQSFSTKSLAKWIGKRK